MATNDPLPYNEKHPMLIDPEVVETRNELITRRNIVLRRIVPAFLTLMMVAYLFRSQFVCNHHYDPGMNLRPYEGHQSQDEAEKVPLEIHIMSKCPDARDCLRELIVPTMVEVSDKVDLTMSFIGR
jgi:hypothetical protein